MKKRSVLLSLFLGILLFTACKQDEAKSYNQGVNVTPVPMHLTQQDSNFKITKATTLVTGSESLQPIADYFIEKIALSSGLRLEKTATASKNAIEIKTDSNLELNDEGYTLNVTPEKVTITGKTAKGAFYGMQTLLQLLPAEIESAETIANMNLEIPVVNIKDEPRFPYRGMHLDVCRHFFSVDFIKKQLDVMAMFKMNYFHWHLTEDQGWRIEIKKYPKLTSVGAKRTEADGTVYGGFYTQEQIKEVVKYAQERFITVIPEIELPGHALAALAAYPEFSCTGGPFKVRNAWGVEPDVYCAGNEATFDFLNDIIDEVVSLFPSEYFHIGGDECPKERWKKCKKCQRRIRKERLKDEHELQSYFIKRVEKMLAKHGKKMIGWDEILEGGLAPNATVMSWRGEEGGIAAANAGHDVIMTPGGWCYLDHFQGSDKVEPEAIGGYTTLEKSYSYEPIPSAISADKAHHVLGTQGNVWSEYLYTEEIAEHRIYPRIIALAEVGWSGKDKRNFEDFWRRMQNEFVRLQLHNINFRVPKPEGPVNLMAFQDSVKLTFTTTEPVDMFYTTDGSTPNLQSQKYTEPILIKENATVKIRAVLPMGKESEVRTIKVEKQQPYKAVSLQNAKTGLMMRIAKGNFRKVSDLEGVTQWKESVLEDLDKATKFFDYQKPSAAIIEGFVEIPETAAYHFSTTNDQLYIDGELLINNDGDLRKFSKNDAMKVLEKGFHPIRIVYLNNVVGGFPHVWNSMNVTYKKDGEDKLKKITKDMYRY